MSPTYRIIAALLLLPGLCIGCGKSSPDTDKPTQPANSQPANSQPANSQPETSQPETSQPASEQLTPAIFELNANDLLAMRLPAEQASQGWVRLFDGHTLYGWEMVGMANWTIKDQTLVVSSGEKSLLCSSLPWKDFELSVEYQADPNTNSGIFLRTPIAPENPATDCYELNIAPPANPFPTGSLVGRQKMEPSTLGEIDTSAWHKYVVRVEQDHITIQLDDKELYTYTDPTPLVAGRIALQHNEGKVAFRNVMARPLGLNSLFPETRSPGAPLEQWKQYPEMSGSIDWDDAGNLHIRGGKKQLESVAQFDNFALLAEIKTAGPAQNSGIFFRCIPGEEMNGYECQINNDAKDGNPIFPSDCGTGGIFRRQDARLIAAGNDEWFSLLLLTSGPSMAAWVNGVQVCEWRDNREPDPNPRRGKRLEPGTLMLQGHDETTDVKFKSLQIVPQ